MHMVHATHLVPLCVWLRVCVPHVQLWRIRVRDNDLWVLRHVSDLVHLMRSAGSVGAQARG
jgi:hypothetical protein